MANYELFRNANLSGWVSVGTTYASKRAAVKALELFELTHDRPSYCVKLGTKIVALRA